MKKLLGLMAIAPMGLAACGGGDSFNQGDKPEDNYQTIVLETANAMNGLGSKDSCDNFSDSIDVGVCDVAYERGKALIDGGATITVTYSDWNTHDKDANGAVQVDVTIKAVAKIDDSEDSGTKSYEVLLSEVDGSWLIDDMTEVTV